MEKIQKDREFCGPQKKGGWSKIEPILAILLEITECVLHGGRKMDCLHTRVSSSNAPVLSKIGKRFYADYHMPTPATVRLIYLLVLDPVLL
jgi:hypothetical protein